MIRAKCWSDDREYTIDFDATPYFKQAPEDDLVALAKCGWARDYPADKVADFFYDKIRAIREMMQFCTKSRRREGEDIGFECTVHPADARAWLLAHKPGVLFDVPADDDLDEVWEEAS